jgi:signal transduction histidine kinase
MKIKESYQDLEQKVAKLTRGLAALSAVASVVSNSLDLDQVLSDTLDYTLAMLGLKVGGIFIAFDGEEMNLRVQRGLANGFVQHIHLSDSLAGQALLQRQPVVMNIAGDASSKNDESLARCVHQEGLQTLVSAPLVSRGLALGILILAARQPRVFSPEELDLLAAIGQQIGTAAENARLYASIQQELAERKHTEQILRQTKEEAEEARRAAEEASQTKSIFLTTMSHELRTPLNIILGFTQLTLHHSDLNAEQRRNLEIIGRSGRHLLTLINDVLEMSKIEAGCLSLYERAFDLYHLLDELETMFRLRAADKGLHISFGRAADLPHYIKTDEGKLRQVLVNLVGNAVKFTQAGEVALRVRADTDADRDRETISPLSPHSREISICFEIQDTGPGIAPGDMDKLFTPFTQLANTNISLPQEGTGLGLSISRQFVRLMGGDITCHSTLGRGSLFSFAIKVTLVEAADQVKMPEFAFARHLGGYSHDQDEPAQLDQTESAQAIPQDAEGRSKLAEILATLPASRVKALQSAAVRADTELVLDNIAHIRAANPQQNGPLADALEAMADNYRFDLIEELARGRAGN